MKLLLSAFFAAFLIVSSFAQNPATSDTTIYDVADKPPYPLFKSCMPIHGKDWSADSIRRCGELQLLSILSANIRYPEEAREQNIQGTVVLSFVVEPSNGRISNTRILKDIGGGCGAEAIRVLLALDSIGLRWAHGEQAGKEVRVRHNLPLKFKLQQAPPFYLNSTGDTIYTQFEQEAQFKKGIDSLIFFVINKLDYPSNWEDSCKTGIFEMALQIRANGNVQVDNVLDFNNLGLDFHWEATRLTNKMNGLWAPATFQGKAVNSTIPLRVVFKSDAAGCESANAQFDKAMLLADEGSELLAQQKNEEAIKKWSDALALQPNNSELLYYRGTALLNENKKEEACQDFNKVKTILGTTWFEDIRRLVCGW
jgi:hypothetical protein